MTRQDKTRQYRQDNTIHDKPSQIQDRKRQGNIMQDLNANTNTNAITIAIAITIATSIAIHSSFGLEQCPWSSPWGWGTLGFMTRGDGVGPAIGGKPGCCAALPCGARPSVARRPDIYVRWRSGGRCGGRSWSIAPWSTSRCCGASPGPSSAWSAASREAPPNETRQDKTRPDQTRQDKTREEKRREDTTRQDKTRQDKTRQDKTRQDKTRTSSPW